MNKIVEVLTRRKVLDAETITETQLARVLNFFDLTALGIGSTLGVGVYVLAGHVAKEVAGPAVVLSFLIAAVASVFAGLCYAEFGSRVPRAGSAYVYSYVCIGEFVAFIIGWNLILEYVIGSASVAKGLSLYLDTMINNTMQETFKEIAPINVTFLSTYFDFFSFGISVLLAVALALGIKGSATVNNVFTMINLAVVLFVIVAGSFKANLANWSLPAPANATDGTGGFFPFGASGVIQGAATCFYGFVGFDCIATTGEEVKNPQKAIPFAIIASLTVIFLAYFGTATVVTLMVPYYQQDINAPLPHAFEIVGWDIAKWIVTIGGIFGLCASLFGAMFPLPRVLYAMASDGVIFKFLGNVNARFQTPLIGTILAGLLTGLMAGLFDLKHLVNMMSIGTLLAYTIVGACVLVLRYSIEENRQYNAVPTQSDSESDGFASNDNLVQTTSTDVLTAHEKVTCCGLLRQMYNLKFLQLPTKTSQMVVSVQIFIFTVLSLVLWLCVIYLQNQIRNTQPWAIALVSIIGLLLILSAMSMAAQPNSQAILKFKVPLVPLIPLLSILVNVYLMLMLDVHTWIRFGVWMAVGLPIYFASVRCDDSLSNNKMHAKVNGHINHDKVITNGQTIINSHEKLGNQKTSALEGQEDLGKIVASNLSPNKKLKPKAPLPPIVTLPANNSFSDTLNVNSALAALDEVLTREELMTGFCFSSDTPFNRKVSVDTVSNVSNVHNEESVVALIHREDTNHDYEHPLPVLQEQTDAESEFYMDDKDTVEKKVDDEIKMSQSELPIDNETAFELKDLSLDNQVIFSTENNSVTDVLQSEPQLLVADKDKVESKDYSYTPTSIPPTDTSKPNTFPDEDSLPKMLRSKSMHATDNYSQPSQSDDKQPPQPPPIEHFFTYANNIAKRLREPERKPSFTRSQSVPEFKFNSTPVLRQKSENEDSEDNVVIGSPQHAKIAQKLNNLLQRRSTSKLTKPEIVHENIENVPQPKLPGLNKVLAELSMKKHSIQEENDIENRGGVFEEVMEKPDIKKKLNEILRSDPRLTVRLPKSNIAGSELKEELNRDESDNDNKKDESNDQTNDSELEAKLRHKNLMSNTLKTIKLRKIESVIA